MKITYNIFLQWKIEEKIEDSKKKISRLENDILWLEEKYKKAEYEFKNPNRHIHFGMYTNEGNIKCRELYDKIIDRINSSEHLTKDELYELYEKESNIVRAEHREFDDTVVREGMCSLINDALKEKSYSYEVWF